jgi:FkbM family methyltransferase
VAGADVAVLARALHAVLAATPAPLVARTRTSARAAGVVERAVALVARPLDGEALRVPRGEAAGLLLRGERRAIAWLTGKVEPEVQELLARLLRPGATFVDVGAGIGFFTVLAARRVGPSGSVVAFEPSPRHAASVRANAALNGLRNVLVVERALSDAPRRAFLTDPDAPTGALADREQPGAHPVEATSLDAFLQERPELAPHVVKVDVEGHEDAVVRGMAATLALHRPHLVVELHGTTDAVRLLEAAGYACTPLGRARSVDDARRGGHVLARAPAAP